MSAKTVLDLMRPPGNGLLTVSTGSALARETLGKYFPKKIWEAWGQHLAQNKTAAYPFRIIGVPSDAGGGICRGAAHGPLHLRKELYRKNPAWSAYDLGDIPCIPQLSHDVLLNEAQREASGRTLWSDAYEKNFPVSPLNLLRELLEKLWAETPAFRPLVLGGDHSISGAVFEALASRQLCSRLAVLHFDAHTDLLDFRYGIENCFGTWTYHALKKLPDPAAWVQLGIRASGKNKKHWQTKCGLRQFWAKELQTKEPKKFARSLLSHWRKLGCERLYLTNDIDGTDRRFVPSTGTPEAEGLHPDWVSSVITEVSRELPLIGADLMEVAPVLGSSADSKKTLQIATRYLRALNWH